VAHKPTSGQRRRSVPAHNFRLARHPPAMGRSGVCTLRIPAAYASQRSFPAAVPSVKMTFIPIFVGITRFDR